MKPVASLPPAPVFLVAPGTALAEVIRKYLLWMLARHQGNVRRTAIALDISERTLRDKLRRYQRELPADAEGP